MKYEYYDTNSTIMCLIWFSTDNKIRGWCYVFGRRMYFRNNAGAAKCLDKLGGIQKSWRRSSEISRSLIAHMCLNESGQSWNWIRSLSCLTIIPLLNGAQYLSTWAMGIHCWAWTRKNAFLGICTSSMDDVRSRINRFQFTSAAHFKCHQSLPQFREKSHLCSNKYTSVGFSPGDTWWSCISWNKDCPELPSGSFKRFSFL